ncbi:hypothetical protein [Ruegeria arenilitoris]|uniref:hypothetical protein n=1 Tax=Ruegeria arenilitoris TaxID=1173585 RepID=UPI00147F826B|nr:hypothetical protein [Ruegeria arenilitoris]
MVQFDYAEGSKRDMLATLTDKGLAARKVGLGIATTIEGDIRKEIGDGDLESLRRILTVLAAQN